MTEHRYRAHLFLANTGRELKIDFMLDKLDSITHTRAEGATLFYEAEGPVGIESPFLNDTAAARREHISICPGHCHVEIITHVPNARADERIQIARHLLPLGKLE